MTDLTARYANQRCPAGRPETSISTVQNKDSAVPAVGLLPAEAAMGTAASKASKRADNSALRVVMAIS